MTRQKSKLHRIVNDTQITIQSIKQNERKSERKICAEQAKMINVDSIEDRIAIEK